MKKIICLAMFAIALASCSEKNTCKRVYVVIQDDLDSTILWTGNFDTSIHVGEMTVDENGTKSRIVR